MDSLLIAILNASGAVAFMIVALGRRLPLWGSVLIWVACVPVLAIDTVRVLLGTDPHSYMAWTGTAQMGVLPTLLVAFGMGICFGIGGKGWMKL